MIKYLSAPGIKLRIREIVSALGWDHIDVERVFCFKATQSKAKYTKARCYGLPRVVQKALNVEPHYIIEVLDHHYDDLCDEHKDKLLIHELLHIPYTFSGALRNHRGSSRRDQVTNSIVNKCYESFVKARPFRIASRKHRVKPSVSYYPAPQVKLRIEQIVNTLDLNHIDTNRVICFESQGSKVSLSPSRFCEFPRIWQQAFGIKPHYIIEILGKNYYKLDRAQRDIWLIKNLLHIPKSFTGSLKLLSCEESGLINDYYKLLRRAEGA